MVDIDFDLERCSRCGLCAELCPKEVFSFEAGAVPGVVRAEECCACMTCSGKCPSGALTVSEREPAHRYLDGGNESAFVPLSEAEVAQYVSLSETLEEILMLRSKPVAITLIRAGEPLPHLPVPRHSLRYCQALIMARRGITTLMPAESHSCPDGASILGLGKVPRKLATGEIYVQLGKLATKEVARQMVAERPALPEGSMRATLLTPLAKPVMTPDVVAVIAPPETVMWLCMASTYFTGKRSSFQMSSYNAQCVETTLYPYTTGEMNTSLGCYGCRAISDLGEEMMFIGIPLKMMPTLIEGLRHLGKKAIRDCRAKVYLPPLV
ncbi:DUF169 domain-containing protein [Geomonas azotofigens]|uniref:DUF169 domain-containing protein n=1 Tax=Geomonas azotofigens TaxID=2843196 RepID=UPI001C10431F|nr:DUF169 domain-containing protein [Geomonas azotofigens]MBU5613858.1 DUF169 domain-containing protein [Geomonas azotofigens]